MINAITPHEAKKQCPPVSHMSDRLIDAINQLILQKFNGENSFDITWSDIKMQMNTFSNFELVDFKSYYEENGWIVKWIKESTYKKIGYDRFEFKPRI